ncbi:unnamed protein product [Rhizophagus irregularis]|nr:unnamed protein product [Rhizophagus irregularis]
MSGDQLFTHALISFGQNGRKIVRNLQLLQSKNPSHVVKNKVNSADANFKLLSQLVGKLQSNAKKRRNNTGIVTKINKEAKDFRDNIQDVINADSALGNDNQVAQAFKDLQAASGTFFEDISIIVSEINKQTSKSV